MEKKLPDAYMCVASLFCLASSFAGLLGLAPIDPPWKQIVLVSFFLSPALFLLSMKTIISGSRSASSLGTLFCSFFGTVAWVVAIYKIITPQSPIH